MKGRRDKKNGGGKRKHWPTNLDPVVFPHMTGFPSSLINQFSSSQTYLIHSVWDMLLVLSGIETHLFLSSPMYTWRANRAKTIRQKIVNVMTSASCLNEWSNALMMVFKPGNKRKKNFSFYYVEVGDSVNNWIV